MYQKSHLSLAILSLAMTLGIASGSRTSGAQLSLSAVEMQALLRNARIIDAGYPLRISVHEQEALVSTKRNPKANETDCKVDAVLMAKTLMDAYPTQVLRVKVLFNNYEENKANQVVVTKGDIKSFGAGAIDQKTLLNSLDYSTISAHTQDSGGDSLTPYAVSPGVFSNERQLLLGHIKLLEKRGTNVKAFQTIFEQIETNVRGHKDQTLIKQGISDLAGKLKEQDKFIRQASLVQKENPGASNGQRKYSQGNKSYFANQGAGTDPNAHKLDPWRVFRRLKAFSPDTDSAKESKNTAGTNADRQMQVRALKRKLSSLVGNQGSMSPGTRRELARVYFLIRNGRFDDARQAIEKLERDH